MVIRRAGLNLHRKGISLLRQRATLFLLGFSLGFNACQQKPTNSPGTRSLPSRVPTTSIDQPFRLGVLGPFTGPAARTGQEFRNAVTMAFEEIDYRIGKYKVELVWIDEQSDPVKAGRAYEEAVIRDKIEAGLLNWHSSVAVACMEITAKYKIPHFFASGATEIINEKFQSDREKYGYWMAKIWPVPAKLSAAYVEALEDAINKHRWVPTEKTMAIYGEDTDWGRSLGGAFRNQFQAKGWKVLAEDYFAVSETDFYPLLQKFKNLEVNLLVGSSTAPPVISAFIKQAREVGVNSLIVADGLGWVGEWYELTGNASNGIVDQNPLWATAKAKAFRDAYTRKWNESPSPSSAGLAYDSARFFIQLSNATLNESGELNRENLYNFCRAKLWTGQFSYTDGIIMQRYEYTPETIPDPRVGKGYYIFPVVQYSAGESKIIWPPEWREGELKLLSSSP
jgi:branched-chain amino acid transport system substrate-binding protein